MRDCPAHWCSDHPSSWFILAWGAAPCVLLPGVFLLYPSPLLSSVSATNLRFLLASLTLCEGRAVCEKEERGDSQECNSSFGLLRVLADSPFSQLRSLAPLSLKIHRYTSAPQSEEYASGSEELQLENHSILMSFPPLSLYSCSSYGIYLTTR